MFCSPEGIVLCLLFNTSSGSLSIFKLEFVLTCIFFCTLHTPHGDIHFVAHLFVRTRFTELSNSFL